MAFWLLLGIGLVAPDGSGLCHVGWLGVIMVAICLVGRTWDSLRRPD
ncbi:MAG: hypothetical protein JWN62_625 [Acidimicrobiales bacterium]|nr:hypothetical protein [Acidimicrobiales bacterium]